MRRRWLGHLDEGPLAEFLVDLRLVHDVLGSAGVFQRAQSLLHSPTSRQLSQTQNAGNQAHKSEDFKISFDRNNKTDFKVGGGRRHGGDD